LPVHGSGYGLLAVPLGQITVTTSRDALELKPWADLGPDEQLALREAYGRYLDTLPPTCDMDRKLERFRAWLAERGVRFDNAS